MGRFLAVRILVDERGGGRGLSQQLCKCFLVELKENLRSCLEAGGGGGGGAQEQKKKKNNNTLNGEQEGKNRQRPVGGGLSKVRSP